MIEAGRANGIAFQNADTDGLRKGVEEALNLFDNKLNWQKLQQNAMNASFLWQRAAREYCEVYGAMLQETVAGRTVEQPARPVVNEPVFAPLLNVVGLG